MSTYVIARFDPGGECWRFYRQDFEVVGFGSLEEAEAHAEELSRQVGSQTVVLTVHACFRTEIVYPPAPDPIRRTSRLEVKTTPPKVEST